MPKTHEEWTVLPHSPIEKLEENLWCVTGTLPGMSLKRVMTLIRLDDGRVVVHSAIALDDASMSEVEAWGKPAVLLVPNTFHRLDAPAYVSRYPDLQVHCPLGGRKKIEDVVTVAGTYDDLGDLPGLRWEYLNGIGKAEAVFSVKAGAGTTLVFNDAVFNMPHGRGLSGFIFRYLTQSTGGPRVTRLFRLFALKDRDAFRAHLNRLAETPGLNRVIVSHHRMISEDPAGTLRKAASTL